MLTTKEEKQKKEIYALRTAVPQIMEFCLWRWACKGNSDISNQWDRRKTGECDVGRESIVSKMR